MPATKTTPRTPAQNSRLWALTSELQRRSGLSREDADGVLHRHTRTASGQEHTSRLSVAQAARVIEEMEKEVAGYRPAAAPGHHEPWGPRGEGPREDVRITQRQQQVLQALFRQAGRTTREQQRAFTRRQCKVPWPQTQRHADALLEPLQEMILRTLQPQECQQRAEQLRGAKGLDAWKTAFIADLCNQFQQASEAGTIDHVMSTHKLAKLVECEVAAGRGA
jgi:hypothetical protein